MAANEGWGTLPGMQLDYSPHRQGTIERPPFIRYLVPAFQAAVIITIPAFAAGAGATQSHGEVRETPASPAQEGDKQ